jgi:hypothetical protein
MKKATKRIPVKFIFNHPDGRVLEKIIYTNNIAKYLKLYNGPTEAGLRWTMVPFKKYRVWLEDSVEPEGGTWWYCLMDANGCLFDPKYPNEERDSLEQFLQWGYKVEEVING